MFICKNRMRENKSSGNSMISTSSSAKYRRGAAIPKGYKERRIFNPSRPYVPSKKKEEIKRKEFDIICCIQM
jgi:hypothetical protein